MVWAVLPGVAFAADPPGTTVTPHSSSTRTTTSVLPTTVTPPGGTAFTGAEGVVPLGAIALFPDVGGFGPVVDERSSSPWRRGG